MKSSIWCLSKATCFCLALILLSTARLHAAAMTDVNGFVAETVIPFTGDGFLNNGVGLYPGDIFVSPSGVNRGFPSLLIGGTVTIGASPPGGGGGLYNYYDYISDATASSPNPPSGSTQNTEVTFQDVSNDLSAPHTDLYISAASDPTRFGNFLPTDPHPSSWGEALVLTSPANVPAKLKLDFATPVQRIGMFFAGNGAVGITPPTDQFRSFFTMDVFGVGPLFSPLGSTTVGDHLPIGSSNAAFIGWESLTTPIGRIVVHETDSAGNPANTGNSPYFDDVRYELFQGVEPPPGPTEIPEPSTLLLASFGLLGLAARRRNKKSC